MRFPGTVSHGLPTLIAGAGPIFRVAREQCSRARNDYRGRSGAAEGTRTPDPNITNVVLYQLSYCGDGAGR